MVAHAISTKIVLNSKEFKLFHKAVEINAVVRFYYTPEEKPTSDCPGSPEDFEIVFCGVDNYPLAEDDDSFLIRIRKEFCDDDGFFDVTSMCEWFNGLEETIMKKFYEEVEADKKGDF